jgi:hypothetical protein
VAELADVRGRIAAQLHGTQAQLGSVLAALAPRSEPAPAVERATAPPRTVAPAPTPPPIDPSAPPAAVTAPEPSSALPAPEPPPALPAAPGDGPEDGFGATTEDVAPERGDGPRESEPTTRPIPVTDPAPGTLVLDAPATNPVARVPAQPTATREASAAPGNGAAEQAAPDQSQPLDAEARRADSRRRRRRSATGATRR